MIKNKNFCNVSFFGSRRSYSSACRSFGNSSFDGWELEGYFITSAKYSLSPFPAHGISRSVSKPTFDKLFLGRGTWSRRRNW